jgi:hypothetical protein
MLTPDEELNEQILKKMRDGGDDLSALRPVQFQFVFPSREMAQKFSKAIETRNLLAATSDEGDGPVEDLPWDVNVTIEMQPNLISISGYERDLGQTAANHGGRGDGWFCERIVNDGG